MMDGKPIRIIIDGTEYEAQEGATVLDILNEHGIEHPQICHVPEVDPIQTCDTCLIEADGKLKRACSLKAENGMSVSLSTERVKKAQKEAMDRILENHLLYCTVCDNNNGNCKPHNTAEMMGIEEQTYPYAPKEDPATAVDMSHPFTAMIRISASRADSVWKCAKISRSMKRCPSIGSGNARGSFGMKAFRSTILHV